MRCDAMRRDATRRAVKQAEALNCTFRSTPGGIIWRACFLTSRKRSCPTHKSRHRTARQHGYLSILNAENTRFVTVRR